MWMVQVTKPRKVSTCIGDCRGPEICPGDKPGKSVPQLGEAPCRPFLGLLLPSSLWVPVFQSPTQKLLKCPVHRGFKALLEAGWPGLRSRPRP